MTSKANAMACFIAAASAAIALASGVQASVVAVSGGIVDLSTLPAGPITANWLIGTPYDKVVFDEAQDAVLTHALTTSSGATIAKGTKVDSEIVYFNSATAKGLGASSVTFNGKVLGVDYEPAKLAATDALGRPGETYALGCKGCGFETRSGDSVTVSGNTVTFHNRFSQPGDFARVFVAVPEPTDWAMMFVGIVGVGAALRRVQRVPPPKAV